MLTITLNDAKIAEQALTKIVNLPCASSTTAWRFSKIIRAVVPHLEQLEQTRTSWVRMYGTEQEDGTVQITDPEKSKEVTEKYMELLKEKIEIPCHPVELFRLDGLNLTVKEIMELEAFIVEDTEETKEE